MKGLLHRLWAVASSRVLSPVVIGIFLLIYIGIAFVTDETLIALMEFTSRSAALAGLLALLPLNSAARLVLETASHLKRRRSMKGTAAQLPAGLFDETVELPASSSLADLEGRLGSRGYKTRSLEGGVAAWRGVGNFPARALYLAGCFCLFAGILISLTTRTSSRGAIIEGVRLPAPSGQGGMVERIEFAKAPGPILSRHLTLEVAGATPGEGKKSFGLYPPSLYEGAFVYPRYLGVGLHVRFSAPDLPAGYETHSVLAIYPPGKEAAAEIPDSPYQIVFSLAQPEDGSDPYMTGEMVVTFKLLKGKEVVLTGSVPAGGELSRDGYHISFPDTRRLVITDFIRDYGVLLIWAASVMFIVALCIWLPVRLFFPRREMLFASEADALVARSRAEGRVRQHGGVFHEALDLLDAKGHPGSDLPPN
ncbi:MAG TPA: hypothetical protein DDY22_09300 [Geobacter sp.]|nr:hypothetical protein [Geobacter sp.]